MRVSGAYMGALALLALGACARVEPLPGVVSHPPAPGSLSLTDAPLAEKLKPRRFTHNGQVYAVELRQRSGRAPAAADGLTPPIAVTGYDIAVSREGAPFGADYGSRGEAGPVAAAYCATLGGRHDDRTPAAFYPGRSADPAPEWVFPNWCQLAGGRA